MAENLTALPIGDSDGLEVGDFVLAIGNPYRIGQTVTAGIISGLHRTNLGIEKYEDFIQTDAAIYRGIRGERLLISVASSSASILLSLARQTAIRAWDLPSR